MLKHVEKLKEKVQKSYFLLLAKSRQWGGFQPRLFLYFELCIRNLGYEGVAEVREVTSICLQICLGGKIFHHN